MQDAVRLYKTGDEGRLLAMNLRKLENGYALQDKPFLVHEIATAFEMENTKTSLIPESISQKPQDDDDQPLTPSDARTFKTCNVSQSSSTRHSTQRGYLFTINEKPDDYSNAKAQEAYPLLTWHE